MSSASRFSVVSPESAPETGAAESLSERVRRLQAEAQALARQQIAALEAQLEMVAAFAQEIADGGEAYPIGAREIARRLAEDLPRQARTLNAIANRA